MFEAECLWFSQLRAPQWFASELDFVAGDLASAEPRERQRYVRDYIGFLRRLARGLATCGQGLRLGSQQLDVAMRPLLCASIPLAIAKACSRAQLTVFLSNSE